MLVFKREQQLFYKFYDEFVIKMKGIKKKN